MDGIIGFPRLVMENKLKDYFTILGVEPDATEIDISKAYRALAREFHPDTNGDAGAEEKFKEINEAYSVLSTPEKKYRYLGRYFLEKLEERDYKKAEQCMVVLAAEFPRDKWVSAQKKLHSELSSRYERLRSEWEESYKISKDSSRSMSTRLREIKHADAIINSYNARELWPVEEHKLSWRRTSDMLNELRVQSWKWKMIYAGGLVIILAGVVWGFLINGDSTGERNRSPVSPPTATERPTSTPTTRPAVIVKTPTVADSPIGRRATSTPIRTSTPLVPTDTPLVFTPTPAPTDTPVVTPTLEPTPEPTASSRVRGRLYRVRPDNGREVYSAFVRKGPGLDHERQTVVQRDDIFYILDEENGWYHIELQDGRTGYVSSLLIEVIDQ